MDKRNQAPVTDSKQDHLIYTILFLLAFAAAIYFRIVNLREAPGWYSDEGNHIDLAENWMQGKWQAYGIIGATERLPLYMYVISFAMRTFGVDILVTRGVSVAANLICVILIGWIAWQKLDRKTGVLAVCLMAAAPWIVAFGRLGLTYNLMAPFFLFSLIAIHFYLLRGSPVWLATAAISAALAFATDYLGIICGITIGLALLIKRPRSIIGFGLIFLTVLILVALPVLLVDAHTFFSDISSMLINRGVKQSNPSTLINILLNFTELLRRESWILVSICGLFLIKDNMLRNIALTAVGLTLIIVTRAFAPVGVSLHYLMHLFPLFALGLAVFLLNAFEFLYKYFICQLTSVLNRFQNLRKILSSVAASLLVFSPLVWMFLGTFSMTVYGTNFLFTGNDNLYLVDSKSADEVRAFVATRVTSGDLVIGSPSLIWGLPTMRRADFLTAMTFSEQDLKVEKTRFTYNTSLQEAKFVILDPLAEEFAPKVVPGMNVWLEEIRTWPVVCEAGEIRVYINPNN